MAKSAKQSVKKPVSKGKKSISKAKSAPAKKSSSAKSSSKSSKNIKWAAPYEKKIKMFKSQGDYFALNEKYAGKGVGTRIIHCGSEPSQEFGGVSVPLDFSSTFAQPAPGQPVVFDYARCGNPTRLAFERQLASLEQGKFAFACSSGMAAHLTLVNTLCQQGDHVLCVDDVYGGTQRYLRKVVGPNAGLEMDFEDFSDIAKFKKMLRPNTKMVWLETPTNPTIKVYDIAKIAEACKGHGCIFVVDNTFATPINTNPLTLGADVVTHSVTKYIGGHSDLIAGAIIMNSRELYDRLFFVLKTMGTGLDSFHSWLAVRSCKTLEVRVM